MPRTNRPVNHPPLRLLWPVLLRRPPPSSAGYSEAPHRPVRVRSEPVRLLMASPVRTLDQAVHFGDHPQPFRAHLNRTRSGSSPARCPVPQHLGSTHHHGPLLAAPLGDYRFLRSCISSFDPAKPHFPDQPADEALHPQRALRSRQTQPSTNSNKRGADNKRIVVSIPSGMSWLPSCSLLPGPCARSERVASCFCLRYRPRVRLLVSRFSRGSALFF